MNLSGKIARDFYKAELIKKVAALSPKPKLAIIQVGENKESSIYIEQKKKFAQAIGAETEHIKFKEDVSFEDIKEKINELNLDTSFDGIIVQMPLPPHLDKVAVINSISTDKDVDGLVSGTKFTPATAKGIFMLLDFYKIDVSGKKVAVLGRSALVGAPTAELFRQRGAIVSVCNSKTLNTKEITLDSDIVVVAIGKPGLIDSSYIKKGAIVIDVGINSLPPGGPKKVSGDVNHADVEPYVNAITPVPGGVGPMTVLALFANLIFSAEHNSARQK